MKQERNFPAFVVTGKQEKMIKNGHLWVYEDGLVSEQEVENGGIVDVFGKKHNYLGSGLYSASSKIRIRLLAQNANETFSQSFFQRRIQYALDYRKMVMKEHFSACRLVHGEVDGLPGVTLDRYNHVVVSEIYSYGMEQRKDWLYQAVISYFAQQGIKIYIYERSISNLREKEGLSDCVGWYTEPTEEKVIIEEYGVKYAVDIVNGQKTGFFLDQKANRYLVRQLAKDKKVLDCCTHTGSFAINAQIGGAKHVEAVDISAHAIASAKENAQLNGIDTITFVESDLFAYMEKKKDEKVKYDFIILDPPAFTKSRKTIQQAYQGYLKANTMALKLLSKGGLLATNSCSHFMKEEMFIQMLQEAAQNLNIKLRLVTLQHASFDHPTLLGMDETAYLKFVLVQVI